jgi:hypothetical protein
MTGKTESVMGRNRFVAIADCAGTSPHLNSLAGLTVKHAAGRTCAAPACGAAKSDRDGTIMNKLALIAVAVAGLGLAACQDNAADNATSTENTIETEAATDTNAALDATDNAGVAADNALDAAGNSLSNAGNAVENAADDVANGQDNVAGQ